MFHPFLIALIILTAADLLYAQGTALQSDEHADVIDYASIDSLWQESLDRGRLATTSVRTDVYRRFRLQCEQAIPMAYLPNARLAFWTNVYLICMMEAMHMRIGYRSTVTDSLWLERDTFVVAQQRLTLQDIRERVRESSVIRHALECLPTGSSNGAPFPSSLARSRRVRPWYRDLFRRVVRSERHVLYDPWSCTFQASSWLRPLWTRLGEQDATFVDYLLAYMTESLAAQVALGAPRLRVVFSDRIETWRKARPR